MSDPGRDARLVAEAIRALDLSNPANPPDRRFGAALITAKGNVYAASAFWSETLSLCLHAEQAALAHAAAHGERDVVALACVSTESADAGALCHPCGLCRQLLYESARASGHRITVLMAARSGAFKAVDIAELTPFPWPA
jgi:cytidine deaminase